MQIHFVSLFLFFSLLTLTFAIEEQISSDVPGRNPKLVELTFEADSSLTNRGFKCTADWCHSYCSQKSAGRKFTSSCDETESCHCKLEPPPGFSFAPMTKTVTLIAPSNKTAGIHAKHIANMTKAECTPKWCNDYCQIKSNGRKFEAKCDSPLSCVCEFAKQPLTDESGSSSKMGGGKMIRKCTQEFCTSFCESKADGRKFNAVCDDSGPCKCEFPWRRTSTSFMASAGPV